MGGTFAVRAACAATLIELGQILRCTIVYLRDARRSLELSFVSCRKTASEIKKRKTKWAWKRERRKHTRFRENKRKVEKRESEAVVARFTRLVGNGAQGRRTTGFLIQSASAIRYFAREFTSPISMRTKEKERKNVMEREKKHESRLL